MTLLILGILIAVLILIFILGEEDPWAIPIIFIICFDLIAVLLLGIGVVNGKVIDEKIAMYTEENKKIEQSIDELVSRYMEFENDTFSDLKSDSAITLVSLYPELKSDELIKTQISTYQENNNTIKYLRAKKINLSVKKWWLYFGK